VKFTIRFADKVVGACIIIALGALIFVIFMLGSSQRWFSKDYNFVTYFDSAAGLSNNMALQYKGFTIGRLKSFDLTDNDRVGVQFIIFDTYIDRVREGSLIEISVSPLGLGSQFLFHPGLGLEAIEEGALIPSAASPQGKALIRGGLASVANHDDSITQLLGRVNTLLDNVNVVLGQMEEAFAGTDETVLGQTLMGVQTLLGQVEDAFEGTDATALGQTIAGAQNAVETLPGAVTGTLDRLLADIRPILANIQTLSDNLAAPGGTVSAILDGDGAVYTSLTATLESVAGTLQNLEKTSAFLPAQLPQVAALISQVQGVLLNVDNVLVSLTNNPLLKNGVPPQVETQPTGTSLRDIDF
jgi:phospholipid/cholesterol/gamma-HCH transport system substrate-binding protein